MATNTLGSVAGKVQTFRDRITDVLNTICTEKPLKIETSTKLEGELKAILEEIGEFSEELVNLKQRNCELEAKPIDVEGNITERSRRRGKSKFLDQHSNERVRALEAEVETLKTQVIQLLAQISEVEGDKMVLEERVVNLEGTVQSLKEEHVKLQSNVTSLTNEVAKLKVSDDELLLGQLCWRIQSMIFKKVLPPSLYNEKVSYKLYCIEDYINALGNEEEIKESEQAWAKLQDELSLHERDVRRLVIAMRNTQSQRNPTAHPPLTEQKLFESAKRMNGKGELKTSYENITKLINLWKELETLQ